MSKRLLLIGALNLGAFTTLAAAQMDHGSHSMPGMSAPATITPGGMAHSMDMGALSQLSGKAFDRAFLSMMIAHHQGAIDMSKVVVNNTKDPQVRRWTADILRVQQQEIGQMNAWLKSLGGVDRAMLDGTAREMNAMLAALRKNRDSDRALVEGMLPHHASAIDMATLALQKSSDARVLGLARGIVRTQADEMYAYRQWLLGRKS